jgi:hypothetical protein
MLKLQRIFKNYQETGAFNEQVNLYGFIDSNVFLTKSGELGVILEVHGVDYECLDGASIDGLAFLCLLGAGMTPIRWRSRCNRFDKSAPSSGFREQKVRRGLSGNSTSPHRPHLSRTRFQTSHRSSGLWPRKMESVS